MDEAFNTIFVGIVVVFTLFGGLVLFAVVFDNFKEMTGLVFTFLVLWVIGKLATMAYHFLN